MIISKCTTRSTLNAHDAHTITSHWQGVPNKVEGQCIEALLSYSCFGCLFFSILILLAALSSPLCLVVILRCFLPPSSSCTLWLSAPTPMSLNLASLAFLHCLFVFVFHLTYKSLCSPIFLTSLAFCFLPLWLLLFYPEIVHWTEPVLSSIWNVVLLEIQDRRSDVSSTPMPPAPIVDLGKQNKKENWKKVTWSWQSTDCLTKYAPTNNQGR